MLILNRSEVQRLLTMKECIRIMGAALAARARGETLQPPRSVLRLPDDSGTMLTMPAWVGTPAALGVKVISVFPGNRRHGKESHQGAVLSIDPKTGEILALLDGGAVTAIRTAAVSAVATNLLARADADDLAILGTGVQAGTHLRAMCVVRQIRRIRIWGRSSERTRHFVESTTAPPGVQIEVMQSPKEAVTGASIICTVTGSSTPVLEGEWIAQGVHINAVGAHTAETRELDTDAITRARIFVDARESALSEAGELLIPIAEGRLSATDIQAELGEVILNTNPGRSSSGEITVFKSLGLGIEDAVAAWHVVAEARRLSVGTEVSLLA